MQTGSETTSITNDPSLKAESFLLEEFRRLDESVAQSNRESSGTYRFYLIMICIIAIAVGTLQIFVYDLNTEGYERFPTLLNVITVTVLLIWGSLSVIFLLRFLQLLQREYYITAAMNKIRTFYINYLKPEMPTLEEAFYKQGDSESYSVVPFYICYTVSVINSLTFSGALFILLDNHFVLVDLFWSIVILLLSFFLQLWYCNMYIAKFKNAPPKRVSSNKQVSSIKQASSNSH